MRLLKEEKEKRGGLWSLTTFESVVVVGDLRYGGWNRSGGWRGVFLGDNGFREAGGPAPRCFGLHRPHGFLYGLLNTM